MKFSHTFVVGGIAGGLHQMLFHGQAVESGVVVELQQSLGQLAVGQSVVEEQGFDCFHFTPLLQHCVDVGAIDAFCGFVEVVKEGEAVDVGEEDVGELGLFAAVSEGEEVLEHA